MPIRRDQVVASSSRRHFLKLAAASSGVLAIGAVAPLSACARQGPPRPEPDSFLRIAPDDTVTVIVKHLEMGQGAATGLATIVAEELDADWAQMRVEFAPAEVPRYANHLIGTQATGGSTSVRNSWQELRQAAAAARQMLVTAAARQWQVPAGELSVDKGVVAHAASGRRAGFGPLAGAAAKVPVPRKVALKDPAQFKLVGTQTAQRIDAAQKIDGQAQYGLDIRRPGMLRAVVARSPRFGGTLKSFDDSTARAVKGVVDVVRIPSGVAVIATDTWSAMNGRDALKLEWDDSAAETRSTAAIMAEYKALAGQPGQVAARRGNTAAALTKAATVVEAEYSFPYLAHAPMEPLNAVVEMGPGKADIWAGSQSQTIDQQVAASALGLKPAQVDLHTVWAGGSFGRRANPPADYIAEAAAIAKAIGGKAPVQLLWTREDDITGGRYRPMFFHKLRAVLDAGGRLTAWEHRLVGQPIMIGSSLEKFGVKSGVDHSSVEGAADLPYAVPNLRVEVHNATSPVPVLWWRSVGHSHTAFAVESFLDEVAAASGQDPLTFRLDLLQGNARLSNVLRLAADKAGWGTHLPKGRGRGLAVHESFSTAVAQVAEVSVGDDGRAKVDRVVVAVDCGIAINPDQVAAQMEGGVGFALGALMRGVITLTDGKVDQDNFHRYRPLRMSEMPKVEVHILPSIATPTGVGEPGVPPLGPAVANAIFAATGRRVRDLPLAAG